MLCYIFFLKASRLLNFKYFFGVFISTILDFLFFDYKVFFKKYYNQSRLNFISYSLFWTHSSSYDSFLIRLFDNILFIVINSSVFCGTASIIESFIFFVQSTFSSLIKKLRTDLLSYFLYGYFFFLFFFFLLLTFVFLLLL